MFINRRARKANATAMYYKNKLNAHFSPQNGVIPELVENEDIPVTTAIYVDFLRTDSYYESGTRRYPFKTLAAAYALAAAGTEQKTIVLLSGNTLVNAENIIFSKGHIFLVGENSSGTHAPLIFYGSNIYRTQCLYFGKSFCCIWSWANWGFWCRCDNFFRIISPAIIFERRLDHRQRHCARSKYDQFWFRLYSSYKWL